MKTCTYCKVKKPLNNFPPCNRKHAPNRDPNERQSRCRACCNFLVKKYYHDNPIHHMLRRARSRSKIKGFECTITVDDLKPLPTHCPVFGMKLTRGNGHQNPSAYSLDRIDNTKGYDPGNVVVMSYLANRLKNDGTAEQHQQIADWMKGLQ